MATIMASSLCGYLGGQVPFLFYKKPERLAMQNSTSPPTEPVTRRSRPDPQIVIHVSSSVKAEFDQYANEWLNPAALAKLLIIRELRLQRLIAMKHAGSVPTRPRQRRGAATSLRAVATRLASKEAVQQFDAYATRCGLSRDSAGAWILQTEIRERWLERAVNNTPSSVDP